MTLPMSPRLAWRVDGNSDPDVMAEAIDAVSDVVRSAVTTCWEAWGMHAERYTCEEAEALARLLYMVEGPDLANDFLRAHIAHDNEEGDLGAEGHTTFVEAADVNGRPHDENADSGAPTITIEISNGEGHVYETTGAFHVENNPGTHLRSFTIADDPSNDEIAAAAGFSGHDITDITAPGEADASYYEIAKEHTR